MSCPAAVCVCCGRTHPLLQVVVANPAVNSKAFLDPAVWLYGVAAVAFGVFSIYLLVARGGRQRAVFLFAGVALSACWAASSIQYSIDGSWTAWRIAHAFDALRMAALFAFMIAVTWRAPANDPTRPATGAPSPVALLAVAAYALLCAWLAPPPLGIGGPEGPLSLRFALCLAQALLGLVLVEQVFRRTQSASRWHVRPLCLALAGMFLYDTVYFTDAVVSGGADAHMWTARGLAHALVIPLFALAATRNREWNLALGVSRSVMSGWTVLIASGLYVLAVGGIGYYIRSHGGSWGRALEIAVFFAALLLLVLVLVSGTFRSKLRVLTSKHFFAYRYDYREEWLRITRALSETSATPEPCIRALAELVESPGGALWLKREDSFAPAANLNMSTGPGTEPLASPFAEYLGRTGWVIDLDEFRARPGAYLGLELPAWLATLPAAWVIVPLAISDGLIGFIVLARPRVKVDLNWEVHDLLKTAGRQIASYLTMLQASEQLLEARKFDAFNRMAAFVVHDLKNLVAQLQLLLRNAERHQSNPEFQQDMLRTVAHVAGRMNQLMAQLRTANTPIERAQSVDLATIVRRVQAMRALERGGAELELEMGVCVLGHADRLERVVGHLVQNAFEATQDNPRVRIRVFRQGDDEGVVEIRDNGVGMTAEFVREQLFRPFQTTKRMGMGIGAYESRQYVGTLRGRITVDSEPGKGTTVAVHLPLAVGPQLNRMQEETA